MKASHNSATGEKPCNFWAKAFSWIAKCQCNTIVDQYVFYGVNLFDIRVRYNKQGELYCYHGLAKYKITLEDVCKSLNTHAMINRVTPIIMVTYEGKLTSDIEAAFVQEVHSIFTNYREVRLGYISVKKPEWRTICVSYDQPAYICNYTKIVGWKVLLPFPRLWQWIRYKDIQKARFEKADKLLMEDFIDD